jgi:copper transport protein
MRFNCAALAAGVLCGLLWGNQVSAHAVLLGSAPQADQVLDSAPGEVVLNFNENVGPIFVKVLDMTGAEVGSPGDWVVDGNDVRMPLGDTLANGTYILTYRVISADTHPVGSTLVFAIGEPIASRDDASAMERATTPWTLAVAVNRFVLYAAMLLAAGSGLLLVLMQLPEVSRTALLKQGRFSSVLAVVAYILGPGLGGAEMLLGGVGALFSPETWMQGFGSTLLPSAMLGIPGVLILYFAFSRRPDSIPLLLVGTALSVGSFLVTGHAATAPPVWLMAFMVAVHLCCAGFWFAALRPLWKSSRHAPVREAGELMVQFSGRAVASVAALFISGAVMTQVQVQSVANMLGTDCGVRLSLKLLLFLALLGLAAMNKVYLTPQLQSGSESSADRLRKSIKAEFLLIVLILAAAVSLTLPSPPRALPATMAGGAADSSGAVTSTATNRGYTVNIEVTPGRAGENMVMFAFTDEAGNVVDMQRVDTTWSLPAASLEGIDRGAERAGPGMYHLMTSDLILPGDWSVRVGAYIDDFDKVNITATVSIR